MKIVRKGPRSLIYNLKNCLILEEKRALREDQLTLKGENFK